jgi:putative acetyltransferase
MTSIAIRDESVRDVAEIRRVNELAFGRPDEAAIVDRVRDAGAVVLSLVAEVEGRLAGHALFSEVTIDGERVRAVGLAPMAVVPEMQRHGIGGALIREGLTRLAKDGFEIAVVLGHSEYYPRFGFIRASLRGLRWEHECRDEAFMAMELREGALSGRSGVVRYRPEIA